MKLLCLPVRLDINVMRTEHILIVFCDSWINLTLFYLKYQQKKVSFGQSVRNDFESYPNKSAFIFRSTDLSGSVCGGVLLA